MRPAPESDHAVAVLHYAPGRGIAEPIRLAMDYAGTPWQNASITTREYLLALQASGRLPFGQVPTLEIDGLQIGESGAILRYVAHTRDLVGDTPADAAYADMLAERLLEVRKLLAFQPFNADPPAELRRILDVASPAMLPAIERWLAANADLERGFAVGRRRTYADLVLVDAMRWLLEHDPAALDAFPALARLRAQIDGDPKVARFYNSDRHYPPPDAAYAQMMLRAMGR